MHCIWTECTATPGICVRVKMNTILSTIYLHNPLLWSLVILLHSKLPRCFGRPSQKPWACYWLLHPQSLVTSQAVKYNSHFSKSSLFHLPFSHISFSVMTTLTTATSMVITVRTTAIIVWLPLVWVTGMQVTFSITSSLNTPPAISADYLTLWHQLFIEACILPSRLACLVARGHVIDTICVSWLYCSFIVPTYYTIYRSAAAERLLSVQTN